MNVNDSESDRSIDDEDKKEAKEDVYTVDNGGDGNEDTNSVKGTKDDTVDDNEQQSKKDINVTAAMIKLDSTSLIFVGVKFGSLDALEKKIKLFEEKNYIKFWKREARICKEAYSVLFKS